LQGTQDGIHTLRYDKPCCPHTRVVHILRLLIFLKYIDHIGLYWSIGAIDRTHVRASVSKSMEAAFRGRKSFATQNVMAAVDFDLRFTYVLAGWEGTAHDAVVLSDALERVNGLRVPEGNNTILVASTLMDNIFKII